MPVVADNSSPKLDPFETALLGELREVVRAQPATRRRRGRVLALAGVAASGAAAVGAVLVTGGSAPAFAVHRDADGDVTVTINRLENASGLEQALADVGVTADVRYQGSTVESRPADLFDPSDLPAGEHRYTDKECKNMIGQRISVDPDGRFQVLIPQAALHTDDTLALRVAGSSAQDADMLLAVGNRSSGCSSLISSGSDGWARWNN